MKLNYKIYGEGDPIVILHGLFGMLDNWRTIAGKLSEHYMVILVDQRNHGRSPHEDTMNYKLMADDLMEFMEDNWIHRAHIMGHSMGGKTAMKFAAEHTDMVEKLIVVDMGIKAYEPGHETIFKALRTLPVDKIESREDAEEHLYRYIPSKSIVLFLMKNLKRHKDGSYSWRMNLPAIYEHYDEILEALNPSAPIDIETLFVNGSKSDYIVEADKPAIKEVFRQASFAEIDAGHWLHAEKPKELLKTILNFLEA